MMSPVISPMSRMAPSHSTGAAWACGPGLVVSDGASVESARAVGAGPYAARARSRTRPRSRFGTAWRPRMWRSSPSSERWFRLARALSRAMTSPSTFLMVSTPMGCRASVCAWRLHSVMGMQDYASLVRLTKRSWAPQGVRGRCAPLPVVRVLLVEHPVLPAPPSRMSKTTRMILCDFRQRTSTTAPASGSPSCRRTCRSVSA